MQQVIHPIYLPITVDQFRCHIAPVRRRTDEQLNKIIRYYTDSAANYSTFCSANPVRDGFPIEHLKHPCQIEKDERFWAAACWTALYYSPQRVQVLADLMAKCFGPNPPLIGVESWRECFEGNLHLFFETRLPSPKVYNRWLANRIRDRQVIPYVLAAAARDGDQFEGATRLDVILLNEDNGFSVFVEEKVISDISTDISFDLLRNQLVRTIDVSLEENSKVLWPLRARRPERTLVVLQTPELFRRNPTARLYGWLFDAYKRDPNVLGKEMPYRVDVNWHDVARRLGWLTWEDCQDVLPSACPWLPKEFDSLSEPPLLDVEFIH